MRCPLPQWRVRSSHTACCRLADGAGNEQPLQWEILSRWGDGSAQWVLIDFATMLGAEPATWILSIHDTGPPTSAESRHGLRPTAP